MIHAVLDLSGLCAPQSTAGGIVRRALTQAPADYMDDVVLVADELVGNAVTHARESVDVSRDPYPWGTAVQVQVQVRDRYGDTAAVPRKSAPAGDGSGLFPVKGLASAWRVQSDEAGKRAVAVFLYRPGGTH
ncbi:ATP-binding protein [Streptomyces sp. NPDC056549]|uniref:ATP-binding protein n=1 Tax=Streptomyces sp. NPDC056549 TaxID=3345864 RepID=UPI0036B52FAB